MLGLALGYRSGLGFTRVGVGVCVGVRVWVRL